MAHERTVSANLKTHLGRKATTIALCWKITRVDGTDYFFTNHDMPITYGGETFSPVGAGQLSDLNMTNTLSVDNQDIDLLFTNITDEELRAGLFDSAEIWTFKINYASVADGIIKYVYGRLGDVEIVDNKAKIEIRSLTQQLSTPIGRIFTPECNASLADSRCGLTLATYTHTGYVNGTPSSNRAFTAAFDSWAGYTEKYLKYGKIVFTSGNNSGIQMQVESNSAAYLVTLIQTLPFAIADGDTFTAYEGCNRRASICKSRFSNFVNFRGFDQLPGLDKIVVIPTNVQWTSY